MKLTANPVKYSLKGVNCHESEPLSVSASAKGARLQHQSGVYPGISKLRDAVMRSNDLS
jgi:hypothetical protein